MASRLAPRIVLMLLPPTLLPWSSQRNAYRRSSCGSNRSPIFHRRTSIFQTSTVATGHTKFLQQASSWFPENVDPLLHSSFVDPCLLLIYPSYFSGYHCLGPLQSPNRDDQKNLIFIGSCGNVPKVVALDAACILVISEILLI